MLRQHRGRLLLAHWVSGVTEIIYGSCLTSLSLSLSLPWIIIIGRKPKYHELEDLGDDSLNIIATVQGKWQKLIAQFRLPAYTFATVQSLSPEDACRQVFFMWLDGGDEVRSPKTWNTVLEVLRNIGHGGLAKKVINMVWQQTWTSIFYLSPPMSIFDLSLPMSCCTVLFPFSVLLLLNFTSITILESLIIYWSRPL